MSTDRTSSPWRRVLGDEFDELHPQLRLYFNEIPRGNIGLGEGEFDTVGTPRPWLRTVLRWAVDSDVLFPVWEHNVSFTVTNTPVVDAGRPAVKAKRTFRFGDGDRIMRDLIVATPLGIVDILGDRRRFRALFHSRVVDGGLVLSSHRVAFRIGRGHIVVPRCVSPRVHLSERFSDADSRQHVSLTMDFPLVGRVYEYAGSFRYSITSEAE